MTIHQAQPVQRGCEIVVPLNRLKKSPNNARRIPHAAADVEALAASIAAKGVLQPPVVEAERNGDGQETGSYLVSIGEGRRLELRLLAKRRRLSKAEPIRRTGSALRQTGWKVRFPVRRRSFAEGAKPPPPPQP